MNKSILILGLYSNAKNFLILCPFLPRHTWPKFNTLHVWHTAKHVYSPLMLFLAMVAARPGYHKDLISVKGVSEVGCVLVWCLDDVWVGELSIDSPQRGNWAWRMAHIDNHHLRQNSYSRKDVSSFCVTIIYGETNPPSHAVKPVCTNTHTHTHTHTHIHTPLVSPYSSKITENTFLPFSFWPFNVYEYNVDIFNQN